MQQLLGRDDELLAIQDALQEAASGFGRTIIMSGIAGAGKSEVLKAGARLAAEKGTSILRGGGALSDGELGYAPLLRVTGVDAVRRGLGPGRTQDAPDDPIESNSRLRTLDSESIAWSLDRCLADLAAQRPVLLVLDDVQWFDEQSLQWMSSLPWRVASLRVVVLVAMSDAEVCSNVALLDNLRAGADAEFRLSNLDRTQISAILAETCRAQNWIRSPSTSTGPSKPPVNGRTVALGRALRVQGAVVGGGDGRALMEESVRVLTGTPFRVELTRNLVECGRMLAEAGDSESAKSVLRDAAPHAYEYGLQPLIRSLVAAYTGAGGRLSKNHIPGIGLTRAELWAPNWPLRGGRTRRSPASSSSDGGRWRFTSPTRTASCTWSAATGSGKPSGGTPSAVGHERPSTAAPAPRPAWSAAPADPPAADPKATRSRQGDADR